MCVALVWSKSISILIYLARGYCLKEINQSFNKYILFNSIQIRCNERPLLFQRKSKFCASHTFSPDANMRHSINIQQRWYCIYIPYRAFCMKLSNKCDVIFVSWPDLKRCQMGHVVTHTREQVVTPRKAYTLEKW